VCVTERERERERDRERDRENGWVHGNTWEREDRRIPARENERERESVCVCVRVRVSMQKGPMGAHVYIRSEQSSREKMSDRNPVSRNQATRSAHTTAHKSSNVQRRAFASVMEKQQLRNTGKRSDFQTLRL
jgi:hypothetical protein